MWRRVSSSLALVLGLCAAAACGTEVTAIDARDDLVEEDPAGTWDDTPYVAFIDGPFPTMPGTDPNAPWVRFPRTMRAGALVELEIATAGGACRGTGETQVDVQVEARRLVVTPYDRVGWTGICNDMLLFLQRPVEVVVPASGRWELVVRGRYFHEGPPAERIVPFDVQ